MEIDLENLYVDVRAKKIKDHCHLATHSKLAFLWKKSLFGWQKYSWALTRELQFLKFLALPYYFQKYYHTAKFTFVLTVSAQHGQSQKTRELMKTAHFLKGYLH